MACSSLKEGAWLHLSILHQQKDAEAWGRATPLDAARAHAESLARLAVPLPSIFPIFRGRLSGTFVRIGSAEVTLPTPIAQKFWLDVGWGVARASLGQEHASQSG